MSEPPRSGPRARPGVRVAPPASPAPAAGAPQAPGRGAAPKRSASRWATASSGARPSCVTTGPWTVARPARLRSGVERRHVGEADQELGRGQERRRVDGRQEAHGPVAAAGAEDGPRLRVGHRLPPLLEPPPVVARPGSRARAVTSGRKRGPQAEAARAAPPAPASKASRSKGLAGATTRTTSPGRSGGGRMHGGRIAAPPEGVESASGAHGRPGGQAQARQEAGQAPARPAHGFCGGRRRPPGGPPGWPDGAACTTVLEDRAPVC